MNESPVQKSEKKLFEIKSKYFLKKEFNDNDVNHIVAYSRILCDYFQENYSELQNQLLKVLDHCFHLLHYSCPYYETQEFANFEICFNSV